jgi:hypothetical protein
MSSYGISGVKFDADRQHITELKIHLSDGAFYFTTSGWWKRHDVLRAFGFSDHFVTIVPTTGNRYQKHADVHAITVDGAVYLRLDDEPLPADDLGELQEG